MESMSEIEVLDTKENIEIEDEYNNNIEESENSLGEDFDQIVNDDPEADRSYRQSAIYDSPVIPYSNGEDRDVAAYGIDVSEHNGKIDWTKVKAAGVDFAIIRVAYRGYGTGRIVMDAQAINNLNGAQAAGIDIGVYFFSTAINEEEAVEEAKYLMNAIKNYKITYPVVFDFEGYESEDYRTHGLKTKTERSDIAIAFLTAIEKGGYQATMYSSQYYLQNDNEWETSRIAALFDVWVHSIFTIMHKPVRNIHLMNRLKVKVLHTLAITLCGNLLHRERSMEFRQMWI